MHSFLHPSQQKVEINERKNIMIPFNHIAFIVSFSPEIYSERVWKAKNEVLKAFLVIPSISQGAKYMKSDRLFDMFVGHIAHTFVLTRANQITACLKLVLLLFNCVKQFINFASAPQTNTQCSNERKAS